MAAFLTIQGSRAEVSESAVGAAKGRRERARKV